MHFDARFTPAHLAARTAARPAARPSAPTSAEADAPVSGDSLAVSRAELAVAALDDLAQLPIAEHVARFDAAHAALADALASIDQV